MFRRRRNSRRRNIVRATVRGGKLAEKWKNYKVSENIVIGLHRFEDAEDEWVISIADNGQGFDMMDANRIFKMFQRLNTRRPGIGMGLAVCKKIIEVHGGTIWANQTRAKGRFFTSLCRPAHSLHIDQIGLGQLRDIPKPHIKRLEADRLIVLGVSSGFQPSASLSLSCGLLQHTLRTDRINQW